MNIDIKVVDINYVLTKNIVTVTLTMNLVDLDTLDSEGNPVVLDTKTISVQQNMLSPTALDELNNKIYKEVEEYLQRAKTNTEQLVNVFGTANPEDILTNVKTAVETNIIPAAKTAVFGG